MDSPQRYAAAALRAALAAMEAHNVPRLSRRFFVARHVNAAPKRQAAPYPVGAIPSLYPEGAGGRWTHPVDGGHYFKRTDSHAACGVERDPSALVRVIPSRCGRDLCQDCIRALRESIRRRRPPIRRGDA